MRLALRSTAALSLTLLCAAAATDARAAPAFQDLRRPSGDWSAAELLGTRVRSADGEEVGEIEDFIFSADAKVLTAVVSVGGLLDIADKLVGVPYTDVRVWSDNETLAVPLTRAQAEAAPAYQSGSPATASGVEPVIDPALVAPPDPADRREAEAEASRSFAGDDPRVADGIAENKKAYKDESEAAAAAAEQDADR